MSRAISVKPSITHGELALERASALVERTRVGAPRARAPYTASDAAAIDEQEKKAQAKASTVRMRSRTRARTWDG